MTNYKTLKVAFFGTSDRSVPILNALNENFDLLLCVTKKDALFGRHQVQKPTGVKKWAQNNNINFLEINSLKEKNTKKVISGLESAKVEYGIVADFNFIIPNEIIDFFENKLINIHFSLLPKYRGASPVQFAVKNGDKLTGVTYQLVVEKLDAGDIIHQIGYNVNSTETSGELYKTLFELAGENLSKVLIDYHKGKTKLIKQEEEKASYTFSPTKPKSTYIFKKDAEINWKEPVESIERKIRAFNPWPIAWTYLKDLEKNKRIAEKIEFKDHVNKELKVKIYEASVDNIEKLLFKTLQVEGKNKINWGDFVNGYLEKIY